MRDDVFEGPLWVGHDQTYRSLGGGVQRVRKGDFSGFQALVGDDVFFGCENKPYRFNFFGCRR